MTLRKHTTSPLDTVKNAGDRECVNFLELNHDDIDLEYIP